MGYLDELKSSIVKTFCLPCSVEFLKPLQEKAPNLAKWIQPGRQRGSSKQISGAVRIVTTAVPQFRLFRFVFRLLENFSCRCIDNFLHTQFCVFRSKFFHNMPADPLSDISGCATALQIMGHVLGKRSF